MLTVHIKGDLNVKTSPVLEEELTKSIAGIKELILNFSNVEYISSVGLRVLLAMEKTCVVKVAKLNFNISTPPLRKL